MSLLCRLGRHRPHGIPRWNDGFYFARCGRCGRDLVRTAFEGWHEPRGFKVVWSVSPPADRPEVALVAERSGVAPVSDIPATLSEPALEPESAPVAAAPPEAVQAPADPPPAPPPSVEPPEPRPEPSVEPTLVDDDGPPAPTPVSAGGSPPGRLPIQDVLAHLNAEEAAERGRQASQPAGEAPLPPPPSPAQAPAPKRRSTWDFMDEEPFEEERVPGAERTRAPESNPAAASPPVDREVEPVSRKAGGLPEWWRGVRAALRNFFSGPAEPRPILVAGLALAVAVSVALGLYSAGYPAPGSLSGRDEPSAVPEGGAGGSRSEGPADPFAASAPHVSPGQAGTSERQEAADGAASDGAASDEVAYVAASLLICRSAPLPQAERVRNLLRGREVRVLGYDGAWASLAYGGGQCWARARYLSPVPPL